MSKWEDNEFAGKLWNTKEQGIYLSHGAKLLSLKRYVLDSNKLKNLGVKKYILISDQ